MLTEENKKILYPLLAQRPPFLFVDKILDETENKIIVEKTFTGEEDFFKGHFPGFPLTPGVILLEALFQSAALLMAKREKNPVPTGLQSRMKVISKVQQSKFKRMVRPPETVKMVVTLKEKLENAYYMSGKMLTADGNEVVASSSFVCMEVDVPKDLP